MVNKVLLVFIVVIALTAMAVGAFVGMELGGSNAGPVSPTPATTGTPTPGSAGTPTPTATSGGGGGTPTATVTPTATATPTATPAPDIDEAELETEILAELNARRDDRGLRDLSMGDTLREMARFHSANMARQGFLSHTAAGYTTAERYDEYDLGNQCKIADDSNTGTREDEALEVLGRVTVGQNGTTAPALADDIVARWFNRSESRTKLTYENAARLGVGANTTDTGRVYLTIDLC